MAIFAGDCLQCMTCSAASPDSCSTTRIENCPDGRVCASQYKISKTNGVISQDYKRYCASQSECTLTGSFTYYSTSEKIATTCCFSDLCIPARPKVPSVNSEPNGLICPMCALPGDSCGANQNMNCTGNETMCLLLSSTTRTIGSQTVMTIIRGCASSGYCINTNVTSSPGEIHMETTYRCSNGTHTGTISNITFTTVAVPTKSTNQGTSHCSFSLSAILSLFIWFLLI
ncbi:uncharacterized protein [Eleutherodactylus coqui]|uniref:uncharacterized protein isoform X2 n=1 Tax=Eleutherodactylus coqui TaxID=57060 RepID=UPI003462059E